MIDNEISFWLDRPTTLGNKQWILFARIGSRPSWVLKLWENKPTDKEVEDCKTLILRSFEFYHKHLEIPRFEMREVDRD